MGGIYIQGMEMPKSCYCCCFFHQTDYWNKDGEADVLSCCKRTGTQTFDDFIKYLPDCPLVPVPPHGDLIDRQEAIIDANERAYDFWLSDDEVNATIQFLNEQTAVIPAEEGE